MGWNQLKYVLALTDTDYFEVGMNLPDAVFRGLNYFK